MFSLFVSNWIKNKETENLYEKSCGKKVFLQILDKFDGSKLFLFFYLQINA